MSVYWQLYRRRIVTASVVVAAVLLALATVTVISRAEQPRARANPDRGAAEGRRPTSPAPSLTVPARDVRSWNAIAPVTPATSEQYPAIGNAAKADPSSYAAAFARELFTRDYVRSSRQQLMEWAQHEDAPLESPRYPAVDWSKVLVDSLVDLSWDRATDTPIPADGPWLVLQSERANQVATNVTSKLDPQWESALAQGYRPKDPLATVRDVTLTVVQSFASEGQTRTRRYAVSLALQLGTSPHGGYGVATTNNYVVKEIS